MSDLFDAPAAPARRASRTAAAEKKADNVAHANSYSAADIEVLEGLEPVRRRPGMYIGGTDATALHHLFAEVIDNSMDEAIAGHATRIEVHYGADGYLTVTDNGRGIPVENHPKFPGRSTLEIVLTTLHAGGKFDSKAYETSGGLHGVGVSVVNALSDEFIIEVARDQVLYQQTYSRASRPARLKESARSRTAAARWSASIPIRRSSATRPPPPPPVPDDALEGLPLWRCRTALVV